MCGHCLAKDNTRLRCHGAAGCTVNKIFQILLHSMQDKHDLSNVNIQEDNVINR